MLQQTQVERVIPKYRTFIQKWGTPRRLAGAPLGDVLREWQGLGYNRRAKLLQESALTITRDTAYKWPKDYTSLQQLPGVGPYTAGAIMAFAYNEPVVMIETNIRTVFLHHFFADASDVSDSEIAPLIELHVDQQHPREWYWALMDYGAHLKKTHGNPNSRSMHYRTQSRFTGSDRQIRGAILRVLTGSDSIRTRAQLHRDLAQFEDARIDAQLEKLHAEELLTRSNGRYSLPNGVASTQSDAHDSAHRPTGLS